MAGRQIQPPRYPDTPEECLVVADDHERAVVSAQSGLDGGNRVDVEMIAAVEAGLRAYDGALLVVSHDETFLESIGIEQRLELPAGDPG